jgi:molybdopterin-guanine dinucleotide biosynthesis protein A
MPDNSSNRLIGVVLCGGKSSRMGSDKGLLSVNSQRWFEQSSLLLSKVFSRVIISVNPNQYHIYKEIQPGLEYVIDSIDFVEGPLIGILSAHEEYPDCDLFVLACDMLNMKESIIQNLVSIYFSNQDKDFYFYQNENYLETLCGIYTANGMKEISQKLIHNSNKNFAIRKLISSSNLLLISVQEDQKKSFANFNSPAEVDITL